jgi:thiamine-phosphate pyrophosphorylase
MKPLADCRLYGFVDTAYIHSQPILDVARALIDGGCDLIQLRAKDSGRDELRRHAESLAPVLQAAGVGFVVNDYPDIAAAVGAELCHLGQEDFAGHEHVSEIPETRRGLRVGLSTHAPDEARRAVAAGAHYIAIGPVFKTGTKPSARPVTLGYVRWAAAELDIPWFAIGGINLQNLDGVLDAGAVRICVVSAILSAPDITGACRAFRTRLTSPRT